MSRPFRARKSRTWTQGFALGWYVKPLRGWQTGPTARLIRPSEGTVNKIPQNRDIYGRHQLKNRGLRPDWP